MLLIASQTFISHSTSFVTETSISKGRVPNGLWLSTRVIGGSNLRGQVGSAPPLCPSAVLGTYELIEYFELNWVPLAENRGEAEWDCYNNLLAGFALITQCFDKSKPVEMFVNNENLWKGHRGHLVGSGKIWSESQRNVVLDSNRCPIVGSNGNLSGNFAIAIIAQWSINVPKIMPLLLIVHNKYLVGKLAINVWKFWYCWRSFNLNQILSRMDYIDRTYLNGAYTRLEAIKNFSI